MSASAVWNDIRGGEAGFTLVELLVGIALLSLLSLALFSSVGLGVKAWQQVSPTSGRIDQINTTQLFLGRLMAQVYPYFRTNSSTASLYFEGTSTSINFLAPAPSVSGGGRMRFYVGLNSLSKDKALVVDAKPELATTGDATRDNRHPLLSNIDMLQIRYFGQSQTEKTARWHDSWSNERTLPSLVSIAVAFSDGHTWPDLVFAPQISVDVNCTFDLLTRRCRGR